MQKYALSIEYCVQWNYTPRAVSLADELLKRYTYNIASLTLIPSSGGRFEVKAGDLLIFSKKAQGRHAQPGEVSGLLEEQLGFTPIEVEEDH